jgi:hypothetical protein
MRKDNSTLLKKLKQYSALAAPLMATAGLANAQVIYTDIDPDVTLLGSAQDQYAIDLNNDGQTDFKFIAASGTASGGTTYKLAGVVMQPYTTGNLNGFIGKVASLANSNFIGYPYALEFNDNIDGNEQFFKIGDIANPNNGSFFIPAMFSVISGTPYGYWGGATDRYVGFQFSPDGAEIHYGWVRCDVAADGTSMTLKDYAYNSTPDEGMFAGQGSPLGVAAVNNSDEFGVFGFEGVANVTIKDGKYDNASITVINAMGQKVIEQKATDKVTRIDLNQFGKGLYVVSIQRGSEQFSKKISFR